MPTWTIHGKRYDLSDFVARHPGGARAIGLGQDRDCTVLFESYHPFSTRQRDILRRYEVTSSTSTSTSSTSSDSPASANNNASAAAEAEASRNDADVVDVVDVVADADAEGVRQRRCGTAASSAEEGATTESGSDSPPDSRNNNDKNDAVDVGTMSDSDTPTSSTATSTTTTTTGTTKPTTTTGDAIATEQLDDAFDWTATPFWDDARAAVRAHFSPRGDETTAEVIRNSKAPWHAVGVHVVGLVVTAFCFWRFVAGDPAMIVLFPAAYWVTCSELMHTGSHFGMSTIPWVNTAAAYMGTLHVQYWLWATQHVVGHHAHTNMHGLDPDVHHFAQDRPPGSFQEKFIPGYRTHRQHQYLGKYVRFWKFAVFFQIGATTAALALLNVPLYLAEKAVMTTRLPGRHIREVKLDRALLAVACLVFMYHRGWGMGGFMLSWAWITHGVFFNVFSQISHVNADCMDGPEQYRVRHGLEKNEWAVHQVLAATDYGCDSFFWRLVSINLNHQICHHLFPSVHPAHYPALRKVLIPVAEKHGLDYAARSSGSFWSVGAQYLAWLNLLNEKKPGSSGAWDTSSAWGVVTIVTFLATFLCAPVVALF